ncbi:MAG: Gfo/Idh/MocA family oxidoreductase [Candidatus Sumerlaeota bacterium]|nr:Gfo/Idh/MocA family oxidoreductase [Candidatus Sumerlaeota bacterium]
MARYLVCVAVLLALAGVASAASNIDNGQGGRMYMYGYYMWGATPAYRIRSFPITPDWMPRMSWGSIASKITEHGNYAYAAGSDTLKLGLIGCGSRGSGAVLQNLQANKNTVLWALGDLFPDRAEAGFAALSQGKTADKSGGSKAGRTKAGGTKAAGKKGKTAPAPAPAEAEDEGESQGAEGAAPPPAAGKKWPNADRFQVTKDRVFSGWDAYQKVLASGVDIVLLTTPPQFRPLHLKAAVEAGKHVFMEKPVAVCPVGVKMVIAAGDVAAQKGVAVVAGTQRRHEFGYLECMKRIHDGAIGALVGGQFYWNGSPVPRRLEPDPKWSDMEYQIRNWYYYTWLSGDHIVEQHIHQIDVMYWAFGEPPVKCMGMGGRQVRTDKVYGNIYDHFAVEYEFANGARVLSMCRQMEKCSNRVGQRVVGTKGFSDCQGKIEGENAFKFQGKNVNGQVQEHADLVQSIMDGKPLNDAKRMAESTMIAIMGRMSAYSGNEVSWKWAMEGSKLDLTPPKCEFGPGMPVEVAMPGKTTLV